MDYLIKNLEFLTSRAQGRQQDAGSTAGVSQSAISKIIKGATKEPGYRTVSGLARHFRVSIDDLVNRDLELDGPGVASQPVGLDTAKLTSLIETVEAASAQTRKDVPARLKARLIATLYADNPELAASAPVAVQALLSSILSTVEET